MKSQFTNHIQTLLKIMFHFIQSNAQLFMPSTESSPNRQSQSTPHSFIKFYVTVEIRTVIYLPLRKCILFC